MTSFEIARFAEILPTPEARDEFARFAMWAGYERARSFARYQEQMRHRGFTPRSRPQ